MRLLENNDSTQKPTATNHCKQGPQQLRVGTVMSLFFANTGFIRTKSIQSNNNCY